MNRLALICGTVVVIVILAGVFTLAWHGTLGRDDVIATVATVVGLLGGGGAVHSGMKVVANREAAPPPRR